MAFQRAEFRSSFGRVITVVMIVLMGGAIASILLAESPGRVLWALPLPLLGATATWVLMWHPRVVIDRDGVLVINPFRTWHLPWGAIRRIDTKWALELYTSRGKVTAFAAPAPSRYGVGLVSREDIRLARESSLVGGAIRPGDSIQTVSGAAAHVARSTWESLRDDGKLADDAAPSVSWNWPSIALIAVPSALAAVGLLLR